MVYRPNAQDAISAYVLAVAFDQGVDPTVVKQPDIVQAAEQAAGQFNIGSKEIDNRGRPTGDLAVCDYNEADQTWVVILADDVAVSVVVTNDGLSVLGYSLRL